MISFVLPFTYQINFIPKRMRNTTTVHGKSATEIGFDEVAAEDAPVAARIKVPEIRYMRGTQERRFTKALPEDRARELRWYDGRHWMEWGPVTDLVAVMEEGFNGKDTPFEGTQSWHILTDPAWGEKNEYRNEAWVRQKHYDLRSLESREERVRNSLRDLAAQIKVIDGVAFEAVSEPNLVLVETYGDDTCQLTVEGFLPERYSSNQHNDTPRHLRRDRLSEMPRMIRALRASGIEFETSCSVEVLMPETFFRSPLRKEALDGARAVEAGLMGVIKKMHRQGLAATLKLRDAITASPGRVSGAVVEALENIVGMEDPHPEWMLMHAGIAEREKVASKDAFRHAKTVSQSIVDDLPRALATARRNAAEALSALRQESPDMVWDADKSHRPIIDGVYELTAIEDVAVVARATGLHPFELVDRVKSGERLVVKGSLLTSSRGWPTENVSAGVIDLGREDGLEEFLTRDPDLFEDGQAREFLTRYLERHEGLEAATPEAEMQP